MFALALILLNLTTTLGTDPIAPPQPQESILERLAREAEALVGLVESEATRALLEEVASLPEIETRKIYYTSDRKKAYTEEEYASLDAEAKNGLKELVVDQDRYLDTFYGTPLAYTRALDLVAHRHFESFEELSIFDFGYGGIGHLRLLASCGANVVGVEVDALLRAMYAHPGDQGTIQGLGAEGSLRLVHGYWPGGEGVKEEVGAGFDLVISKNVLKRGYVRPSQPVPDNRRLHLGVSDDVFKSSLFAITKPGGFVLIYNIGPAQAKKGEGYIPWAEIESPFTADEWKETGFQIEILDHDDTGPLREFAKRLGWGKNMDLENGLFAKYTLLRRPS